MAVGDHQHAPVALIHAWLVLAYDRKRAAALRSAAAVAQRRPRRMVDGRVAARGIIRPREFRRDRPTTCDRSSTRRPRGGCGTSRPPPRGPALVERDHLDGRQPVARDAGDARPQHEVGRLQLRGRRTRARSRRAAAAWLRDSTQHSVVAASTRVGAGCSSARRAGSPRRSRSSPRPAGARMAPRWRRPANLMLSSSYSRVGLIRAGVGEAAEVPAQLADPAALTSVGRGRQQHQRVAGGMPGADLERGARVECLLRDHQPKVQPVEACLVPERADRRAAERGRSHRDDRVWAKSGSTAKVARLTSKSRIAGPSGTTSAA